MPEKGWKIITVRESTHRALVDLSKKRGVSIDEWIQSKLTSQPTSQQGSRVRVSKGKRVGVTPPKLSDEEEVPDFAALQALSSQERRKLLRGKK